MAVVTTLMTWSHRCSAAWTCTTDLVGTFCLLSRVLLFLMVVRRSCLVCLALHVDLILAKRYLREKDRDDCMFFFSQVSIPLSLSSSIYVWFGWCSVFGSFIQCGMVYWFGV
jgi:hypothetical protein